MLDVQTVCVHAKVVHQAVVDLQVVLPLVFVLQILMLLFAMVVVTNSVV